MCKICFKSFFWNSLDIFLEYASEYVLCLLLMHMSGWFFKRFLPDTILELLSETFSEWFPVTHFWNFSQNRSKYALVKTTGKHFREEFFTTSWHPFSILRKKGRAAVVILAQTRGVSVTKHSLIPFYSVKWTPSCLQPIWSFGKHINKQSLLFSTQIFVRLSSLCCLLCNRAKALISRWAGMVYMVYTILCNNSHFILTD